MRASCVCRHCRCPNFAQEGEPTGLCLVCERVELWGKNSPAYRGCRCTCRCKLQREVVSLVHERAAEEIRGQKHQHQRQHSRHPTNPNPLPSPVRREHSRHPTHPNPNPNPNPLPSPIKHGNRIGSGSGSGSGNGNGNRLGYPHAQQRHVSENDSAAAAAAAAASTHLLCADCAEQHRSNPRRHRPHGILQRDRDDRDGGSSPSNANANVNVTPRRHQRRVTSIGFNACKGIGFTPSSKVQAQEWKRPCLTPYARKRCNMITG